MALWYISGIRPTTGAVALPALLAILMIVMGIAGPKLAVAQATAVSTSVPRWAPAVTAADLAEAERVQAERLQATRSNALVARNRLLLQELALRRGRLPSAQQAEVDTLQAAALIAYRAGDYAAAERGFAAIANAPSVLAVPVAAFLPADATPERLLPLPRGPEDDALDEVIGLLARLRAPGCEPATGHAFRVLEAQPDFVDLRRALAECLMLTGQAEQALQQRERIAAAWLDVRTAIELGRAQLRAGHPASAQQTLAAALRRAHPVEVPDAAGGLAAAAEISGNVAGVGQALGRAVDDLPNQAAFDRFANDHRGLLLAAGSTPEQSAAWLALARRHFNARVAVRQAYAEAIKALQSPSPNDLAQRVADLPRSEAALAAIQALLGAEHPRTIDAMGILAASYSLARQHERALAIRERQAQSAEQALGAAHTVTVSALQRLASEFDRRGDLTRALLLLDRANALASLGWGASHPRSIDIGRERAKVLQRQGQPDAAIAALVDLAARLETSEPWGAHRAGVLRELSELRADLGKVDEALRDLEAALGIACANGDFRAPRLTGASGPFHELGRLYRRVGSDSAALRYVHLAMVAGEAPNTYPLNALRLWQESSVAMIHLYAGRPSLAEYFIRRSELPTGMLVEDFNPRASEGDRRRLYAATGRLPEALALAEVALRDADSRTGDGRLALADAILPVAELQQRLGQREAAKASFRRRLAVLEAALGPDHPRTGDALQRLAFALVAGPQQPESLALFQRSASIATRHGDDESLWLAHIGTAATLGRGREPETIFHAKLAVSVLQRLRGRLTRFDDESRRGFVASRAWPYRFLADRLIAAGRIGEAQRVMAMLKEQEFVDFVRRDASADPERTPLPLTELEASAALRHTSLNADIAQRATEAGVLEAR